MTELTTNPAGSAPADLTADEIAADSGGNGVVGPSGGRSESGGGTLGSGS